MKYKKHISILVVCIVVLSFICSLSGLLISGGSGVHEFNSINNEVIKINGVGLYKNDSISVAAQGRASDLVTLVAGIPLLMISLFFARRGSFRARLLLTGTLGYFLYTFISYTFLWMYNPLFIIYVILMSASLFAFILAMMTFDVEAVPGYFNSRLPVGFIGGFQLFIAFSIAMLWLGKIAPSIINGAVPAGLEHYTTLVIQGMDLGIVVPAATLSGILIIKRKPYGYLLSSVIILKGITMLTSITAMIINQALNKVDMNIIEVVVFVSLNLTAIIPLIMIISNVKNDRSNHVTAA